MKASKGRSCGSSAMAPDEGEVQDAAAHVGDNSPLARYPSTGLPMSQAPASPQPSPPIVDSGLLDVGDGHSIYWQTSGNPQGVPVVIVHGGPGGALNPRWGEFFDPSAWRLIFFDQRGCGRSTPFGATQHNTLADLVGDMERLRQALQVERWALFGGSWGTTLALAYGAAFPQRCRGFLLRGVFLAREPDIDWFLWDARRLFPEAHRRFMDALELASGSRARNAREVLALAAAPLARFDEGSVALAKAWSGYEASMSAVGPLPDAQDEAQDGAPSAAATPGSSAVSALQGDDGIGATGVPAAASAANGAPLADPAARRAVSVALLEHHYMAHELPPAPSLLERIGAIRHLPCRIVHGRFDIVCPVEQALELAARWPRAGLEVVPASGHWTFEKGIVAALHRAVAALAIEIADEKH